ncbi:MAG: hypothetical protein ACRCVH_12900 [Vagococcus fluvialis]
MKFNIEDFIDEMHEYVQVDQNKDDFVYGNYADWDEFRSDYEEELLEYFSINLPWDKGLTLDEYFLFLNQSSLTRTNIIEDFSLNDLEINDDATSTEELIVYFPEYSKDIVNSIFDYYEVPSGFANEYELPEEFQFWRSELYEEYEEYEMYVNHPIIFDDYIESLADVKEKFSTIDDDLIRKSLLLSSFIISENFFKSIIVQKAPSVEELDEFHSNIVVNHMNNQVNGTSTQRNKLFKKLYGKEAPKQEWIELRNALAHDIDSAKISEESITYTNLKTDKEKTYQFNYLFDKQIKFAEDIAALIQ